MSSVSSQPGKYEFLVTIPDKPNALENRLAVRPEHLKNIKPLVDSGKVVLGGATLDAQPKEGESLAMNGSVMIVKADSEQEVRDMILADVYVKGGAWDASKVDIKAFKSAVRTAL
jgi:uncharacterized protein